MNLKERLKDYIKDLRDDLVSCRRRQQRLLIEMNEIADEKYKTDYIEALGKVDGEEYILKNTIEVLEMFVEDAE